MYVDVVCACMLLVWGIWQGCRCCSAAHCRRCWTAINWGGGGASRTARLQPCSVLTDDIFDDRKKHFVSSKMSSVSTQQQVHRRLSLLVHTDSNSALKGAEEIFRTLAVSDTCKCWIPVGPKCAGIRYLCLSHTHTCLLLLQQPLQVLVPAAAHADC